MIRKIGIYSGLLLSSLLISFGHPLNVHNQSVSAQISCNTKHGCYGTPRSGNQSDLVIISPRSQAIVNDRPSLTWSYVERASQYSLTVFDTAAAEAPKVLTLVASDLTPSETGYVTIAYPFAEALQIGKQYTFQVEAQVPQSEQQSEPHTMLTHEVTFAVAADESL